MDASGYLELKVHPKNNHMINFLNKGVIYTKATAKLITNG